MEEKLSTSLKKLSNDNLQLKGELSKATQKLKDLSTKFDENESNWKRAGDTFCWKKWESSNASRNLSTALCDRTVSTV